MERKEAGDLATREAGELESWTDTERARVAPEPVRMEGWRRWRRRWRREGGRLDQSGPVRTRGASTDWRAGY